jgi:sulfur-oxidizing protein SoxX
MKGFLLIVAACAAIGACAADPGGMVSYPVHEDSITTPLTALAGDAARGREVIAGREGNCLLCHAVQETGERFMGNVAPPLSGVGARLSAGQIRLRVVDPTRLKRDAVMPAYYRVDGLNEVALPYRGKPILSAQQVEDVVAYLVTLR